MTAFDIAVLTFVAVLSFGLAWLGSSIGLVFGQLRLPALVYWLGSPVVGAGTSLAISAVGALVGALQHGRSGRVSARLMLTVGAPSAAAAFFTARRAGEIDPVLVKAAIGATLVVMAAFMLRRPQPAADAKAPAPDGDPPRAHIPGEIVAGALLGAVGGLVGLLMGTLRLPTMMRLGADPARAVGTNLAIGCITGVFAAIATAIAGNIDWTAFAVITPTTMLGAWLGANATGRLHKERLHRVIAWALVAIGLSMVAEGFVP